MNHSPFSFKERGNARLNLNRFAQGAMMTLASLTLLVGCKDDSPSGSGTAGNADQYIGPASEMTLGPETNGFNSSSFTLAIEAPDGTIIKREGSHSRQGYKSHLSLSSGLSDGIYRLLYFEYPIEDNPQLADLADQFSTTQFGLGSRIEVKNGSITILDSFDEEIGFPGKGTAEEPYEISSYNSLLKLAQIVNSEEKNELITKETHFRQTGKIDLYQASREADRRYGWNPIGANSALPFRGHYHGAELSTMIIDRPNSAAVGLFGHVHNAAIYDLKISNSSVTGNFAAGGIVGASLMSGKDRGLVTITGCEVTRSEITGSDQSVSIGGIIGAIDMQSRAYLQNCTSSENTIKGTYNAGGLAGGAGLYSSIAFSSCKNSSSVTSDFSGAGGLIGSCDTVQAAVSSNTGRIQGAALYRAGDTKNTGIGSGGLVGGAGTATMTSCSNAGTVSGYAGVGGLVGSARVKGSDTEAYMYNNVMFRYSWNEGDVNGTDCVGGLTGEAQCGTYGVYNKGNISGTRYVGGIAGSTSIAVTHNAINLGKVSGGDYVAGIVGKTAFGSLALDHNYGEVNGTGTHLGGITALAGNNTIIHYCGNYGSLKSTGSGPVGGIVGEIGDPRKWTAMNIVECVIGSAEVAMAGFGAVMAVAGHSIAALSETLEVFLHIAETMTDCGLLTVDSVMWGIGVQEMIEEFEAEKMASELSQEIDIVNSTVKAEMAALRRNFTFNLKDFNHSPFDSSYMQEVDNLLNYYESDGGDDKFNEKINLAREEREEYLEKVHKTNEIIHQVVGGVCIVVGTVASIGGIIASGGAAAPFVVAGIAASVAGGLNAITKSCLEYEENAVIISQCVNGGAISSASGSQTGGLVGVLQDNSIVRDCINTGDGPGHGRTFVGKTGSNIIQMRLISLANSSTWDETKAPDTKHEMVIYNPDAKYDWDGSHMRLVKDRKDISDPATYTAVDKDWKTNGTNDLWIIPSVSNSFPVPAWSEMRD